MIHTSRRDIVIGGKTYRRYLVNGYYMCREVVDGVADPSKTKAEHRLVYEATHGVVLPDNVVVHHLNRNGLDNDPKNLVALSYGDHTRLHHFEDGPSSFINEEGRNVKAVRKPVYESAFSDRYKNLVSYNDVIYYRIVSNGLALLFKVTEDGVDLSKSVLEHRVVYEKAHNVCLLSGALVRHINGDTLDNRPENLELANCVYKPPVKKPPVTDKVTKEELEELIKTHTNVQIGKMFGVSDSAVKKWRKGFGLPSANEQHGWSRGAKEGNENYKAKA